MLYFLCTLSKLYYLYLILVDIFGGLYKFLTIYWKCIALLIFVRISEKIIINVSETSVGYKNNSGSCENILIIYYQTEVPILNLKS